MAFQLKVQKLRGIGIKPAFDEHLYQERHRIENLFARLKAYRRIATRFEKLHSTFSAMTSLACILIWLKC